jgi:ATP-dependent protease ClpP protease subunit
MLYNDIIKSYVAAPPGIERFAAIKIPNTVSVQATAAGYDLLIYDCIGCGCIEADDIIQALAIAGGAPVRVRINSPGGDAFEGFAIHNVLKSYEGEVTVLVDGVAASAAAYVAMAGSSIEMQPASFMMIHNGWTVSIGDKNRLGTVIQALTRIDQSQAKIFAAKSGLKVADVQAMLDAETWFAADEAVQFGLADDVIDPQKVGSLPQLPSDPDNDEDQDDDDDSDGNDSDGDEQMPQKMPNMLKTLLAEFDRMLDDFNAATSVNGAGVTYANSLVAAGKVNTDADWTFDASDGNALLGSGGDDWANYAKHFMAVNSDSPDKTKGHWSYPFAKGDTLYRSALIAIRQRAAQQNVPEVSDAAGRLLDKIDGNDKPKSMFDIEKRRRLLQARLLTMSR